MRSPARGGAVAGVLPAFWPSLGTVAVARRCRQLVLRDDLPFDPGAGLHRARLPSAAGETWLTLPVRSSVPGTPACAIALAPACEWAGRAMRAIEHAFADATYFEHYRCDLAHLLFGGFPRLVDLDLAMLRFLLRSLGIACDVLRASEIATGAPIESASNLHSIVSIRPAVEALLELGPGAQALIAPRRVATGPRRGVRPPRAERPGIAPSQAAAGW